MVLTGAEDRATRQLAVSGQRANRCQPVHIQAATKAIRSHGPVANLVNTTKGRATAAPRAVCDRAHNTSAPAARRPHAV
jgi:hypothetical protein